MLVLKQVRTFVTMLPQRYFMLFTKNVLKLKTYFLTNRNSKNLKQTNNHNDKIEHLGKQIKALVKKINSERKDNHSTEHHRNCVVMKSIP